METNVNNKCKAFTSLEQSKKLAEILPLESADYCWGIDDETLQYNNSPYPCAWKDYTCKEYYIPCWSLTALLGVLPISCDDDRHCLALINSNPNGQIEWLCCYEDCNGNLMMECYADNPVDACYEMILKLYELKML